MVSLINKQLLLTAYAYLYIMEQQKAQQGSDALQLQANPYLLQRDRRYALGVAQREGPFGSTNAPSQQKAAATQVKRAQPPKKTGGAPKASGPQMVANGQLQQRKNADDIQKAPDTSKQTQKQAQEETQAIGQETAKAREEVLAALQQMIDSKQVTSVMPHQTCKRRHAQLTIDKVDWYAYDDCADKLKSLHARLQEIEAAEKAKAAPLQQQQQPNVCGYCTVANKADATSCEVCDGSLANVCGYCSFANKADATSCEVCDGSLAEQEEQKTEQEEQKTEQEEQKKICKYCTFGNPVAATVCEICAEDLPLKAEAGQKNVNQKKQPQQQQAAQQQQAVNQKKQPQQQQAAQQQQAVFSRSLKVFSYNLDDALSADGELDEFLPELAKDWCPRRRFPHQAERIAGTGADLVFLQEFTLEALLELRKCFRTTLNAYDKESLTYCGADLVEDRWRRLLPVLGVLDREVLVEASKKVFGKDIICEIAAGNFSPKTRFPKDDLSWETFLVDVSKLILISGKAHLERAYTTVSFKRRDSVFQCQPTMFANSEQGRGFIKCRTGDVDVYGVHLESLRAEDKRQKQIQKIKVDAGDRLAYIIGDFNQDGEGKFNFDSMGQYERGVIKEYIIRDSTAASNTNSTQASKVASGNHAVEAALQSDFQKILSDQDVKNFMKALKIEKEIPVGHWDYMFPSYIKRRFNVQLNTFKNSSHAVRLANRIQARVVDYIHDSAARPVSRDAAIDAIRGMTAGRQPPFADDNWRIVLPQYPSYAADNRRKTKRREQQHLDYLMVNKPQMTEGVSVERLRFDGTEWDKEVRATLHTKNRDVTLSSEIPPSDHDPVVATIRF